MLQDIKEVTKDVRKIIAEQLGTEEDKVCLLCTSDVQLFQHRDPERLIHHKSQLTCATSPGVQVQADSNFADLGADSLDTVSRAAIQKHAETLLILASACQA